MDAESGMVEQAARLVAANPAQKVGVYRNIIAAQPWFPSVAAKLRDPKYSSWFLPFKDDHSPTVAPRCDSPDPPQKKLCSNLFHGNQQVLFFFFPELFAPHLLLEVSLCRYPAGRLRSAPTRAAAAVRKTPFWRAILY